MMNDNFDFEELLEAEEERPRSAPWMMLVSALTSMLYILLDPLEGTEKERVARVRNMMRAISE